MAPGAGDRQFLDQLVDVSLGGVQLDEIGTSPLETLQEVEALSDGLDGGHVLQKILLVDGLVLVSLGGGGDSGGDGLGLEGLVGGDQLLEFLSLGIEGVHEMGAGDGESDFSVSESLVPLDVELVVFGGGPSVLLVLGVELEVQVSDEVLEGGNELRHGASSFDLKFHEASSDLSPAGFFEGLNLALHRELVGGLNLH